MADYNEIIYAVEQGVLTLTLNRPDRLNAWTRVMEREVRDAMERASADDAVRVILLTGAGRGFCAGADMNLLSGISASGGQEEAPPPIGAIAGGLDLPADFHLRYTYFPTVPKPIIAAINGPCAGLGMVIALYADMRFAAHSAVFTTAFSRRGLIAEHGISWMLPRLGGLSQALDLLLSARKISAEEALSMGIVNQVTGDNELLEQAIAYARTLAKEVSPRSMRVMKEQLYRAQFQTLAGAVDVANHEMQQSFDSEDFKEGVAHFLEKRPPAFTGR